MSGDTVLAVADYAALYAGNFIASQVAVGTAVRDRLGLRFELVLPNRAAERPWVRDLDRSTLRVSFLPPQGGLASGKRLRELVRARPAPIIHSHFTGYDVHCLAAAAGRDVRVLWHVRNGLWGYPPKQRGKDLLKVRLLGRRCDMVVANSEQTGRDSLLRGFPSAKVAVVLNGIVHDRFEGHPAEPDETREPGADAKSRIVLGFCWDPARKGADVLVEGVARLQDPSRPPVHLLIVGQEKLHLFLRERFGPELPPPWLDVRAPVDDVASLLRSADVFVSASREDAFSYAIGEAMAAGLPVVSSDIPGPAHYFAAEGLFTYSAEDPDALARTLSSLFARSDRSKLGALNRDFVRARVGVERHVDAILALYARMLRVGA